MKAKKREAVIKLILITFFVIFFAFLFWYFYNPSSDEDGIIDRVKDRLNLFPFDEIPLFPDPGTDPTQPDPGTTPEQSETEKPPRLRQISDEPTAGIYFHLLDEEELEEYNGILERDEKVSTADKVSEIRYLLSKNSHIYNTHTNTLEENRISNVTIPKIYKVSFFDKDNFLVRYLNEGVIKTYSISLSEKTPEEIAIAQEDSEDELVNPELRNFNGVFLPNDILEITTSPIGSDVFYLNKNPSGVGLVSYKSRSWGEDRQQLKSFDLTEWDIDWVTPSRVLFTSKPSKNTHSLSLVYDLRDGSLVKIAKALQGGKALANENFSKILYSGLINNKYTLLVYDVLTKERRFLETATLVDKCVWSNDNIHVYCAVPSYIINQTEQPDAWYRGYNYFTDSIYRINTSTDESELVYFNFADNPDFDIVDLKLDPAEKYLYWIDKKTDFAWSWELFNTPVEEEPVTPEITEEPEPVIEIEE